VPKWADGHRWLSPRARITGSPALVYAGTLEDTATAFPQASHLCATAMHATFGAPGETVG
jgi:hypothetical protein